MRGGISNEGRVFCSIEDGEPLTHSSSLLTDPFQPLWTNTNMESGQTWNTAHGLTRRLTAQHGMVSQVDME